MPRIAELRNINGSMWARLDIDIDWDGGSISLYTEAEIAKIKADVIKDVIYYMRNFDKLSVRDD